ncbi:SRPBCC family protein [Streptomyces ziwulingensis]|uniref:SRPBCC family protein n=1 Tax=Streptomyces ziwulingensis TaxID=1045501 RepID=A0ABP9CIT3_9ACTN
MGTIEETIQIAVPVRTAYDQWTQFELFPRFMSVVRSVEQIRPSLVHWAVGAGPVRHEFTAEIVEQRPDALVAWRSLDGRHHGEVSFLELSPERTSVTVRVHTRGSGLKEALAAGRGPVRRAVRSGLAHFKEFIEGLGAASGAWRGTIRGGHVQPDETGRPAHPVPHWPHG